MPKAYSLDLCERVAALSVRAGRGTLPRPISKCQFLSS